MLRTSAWFILPFTSIGMQRCSGLECILQCYHEKVFWLKHICNTSSWLNFVTTLSPSIPLLLHSFEMSGKLCHFLLQQTCSYTCGHYDANALGPYHKIPTISIPFLAHLGCCIHVVCMLQLLKPWLGQGQVRVSDIGQADQRLIMLGYGYTQLRLQLGQVGQARLGWTYMYGYGQVTFTSYYIYIYIASENYAKYGNADILSKVAHNYLQSTNCSAEKDYRGLLLLRKGLQVKSASLLAV